MEYKRLTDKRLAIPKNAFRQAKSKEEYLELARIASKVDNAEIYNRLAELEDKIEQGTLIDTKKYFIVKENQGAGKIRYLVCHNIVQLAVCGFCKTREEAEQCLKELQV